MRQALGRRRLALAAPALLALLLASSFRAEAAPSEAASVVVKLRSEGPHAVLDCAERRSRRGEPLAPATADGSDSLDTLGRSLRVRSVRAVFRRPDGVPLAEQRQRLAARRSSAAAELAHVYRLELPAGVDAARAAALYAADPHVAYAQPNFPVESDRLLDDPFLHSAGSWGQPYADLWGLHRIGAPEAWERTLGAGAIVAVADTGVDHTHPDLVDNLWIHPGEDLNGNGRIDPEERNGIDDDGNGFVDDLRGYDFHDDDADPFDESGHGTHVAGIAAARGNNGLLTAGVAPFATVMPVKVLGASGSGETDRVWRGVLYAAENGADVINASFSCSRRCRENPLAEEVVRLVTELGAVVVTSAGNRSEDVLLRSPERLRETIAVGSVGPNDALSDFSNFGWLVDVVAPGDDILSLRSSETTFGSSRFVGDGALRLSGTSMSTPHVAGTVALLRSVRPELTYEEIRAVLRLSAEELGAPGPDRRFGSGLLRPDRALATPPPRLRGEIVSPEPGATLAPLHGAIAVRGRVGGADLATHALELGIGATPEQWLPLPMPRHATGEPPVLGIWRVADFPDGRYVLRLRLVARDGRVVHEHAPLALERSRPRFVSLPGRDAFRPALAGLRVVWEALSRRGDDEAGGDLDLFQGLFGVEGEAPLVEAPDDQRDVALSRSLAAWRERPADTPPGFSAVRGCRLRGPHCDAFPIGDGLVERGPPAVSGRRIVYRERQEGTPRLLLCELAPWQRTCRPRRIASESVAPRFPHIDGRRLLWRDQRDGRFQLVTCRLEPVGGACPEVALALASDVDPALRFDVTPRALAGRRVAYEDVVLDVEASSGFRWRLHLCELDPISGACPPIRIDAGERAFEGVDLSGRRLVWDARDELDDFDVFICTHDPVRGRCPAQRITSDPGNQSHPRLEGRRVVWQDDRSGVSRIASFVLPALAPLRDRTVHEGRVLSFPVRARLPEDPRIALSAHTADGEPVETLGARLERAGPWAARFVWRPLPGQAGVHAITFRATRPSGLFDERTLQIRVREARQRRLGAGEDWP